MFYRTKKKFEPILDGGVCLSYSSGKNTDVYLDNCYPKVLKKIYDNATTDNRQDFLLVDLDAPPENRFRKNFNDIYEIS